MAHFLLGFPVYLWSFSLLPHAEDRRQKVIPSYKRVHLNLSTLCPVQESVCSVKGWSSDSLEITSSSYKCSKIWSWDGQFFFSFRNFSLKNQINHLWWTQILTKFPNLMIKHLMHCELYMLHALTWFHIFTYIVELKLFATFPIALVFSMMTTASMMFLVKLYFFIG